MNKFKMTDFPKIAIASLLLMISMSAQAFQVVLDGTGTNATSILNLDIGGTFYDVTFEESLASAAAPCPGDGGTYPCDLYAANPASDPGNQTGATAAATQIALALNEDISISGSGSPLAQTLGPAGLPQSEVLVPWHFDVNACNGGVGGTQGTCAQQAIAIAGAGSWGALGIGTQEVQSTALVNYARFAPAAAVVPIPPAAWLFGSALGLLGWVRRRGNRAAVVNGADSHRG
jgi:hypothetical protein